MGKNCSVLTRGKKSVKYLQRNFGGVSFCGFEIFFVLIVLLVGGDFWISSPPVSLSPADRLVIELCAGPRHGRVCKRFQSCTMGSHHHQAAILVQDDKLDCFGQSENFFACSKMD